MFLGASRASFVFSKGKASANLMSDGVYVFLLLFLGFLRLFLGFLCDFENEVKTTSFPL